MNGPETGHGLPTVQNGVAIRNTGAPLGYQPLMTDATKATTFDDLGSTLSVFDPRPTSSSTATSTSVAICRCW